MNDLNTSRESLNQYELKPLIDEELLKKVATYFSLLDNPDTGLMQEQAEIRAGKYFAENIANKYSPAEINTAIFMSR
jgi:hypothetical protein